MIRQRGFAAINLIGLALGLTICIFILLYVRFEHSYDEFHTNADRIVRTGVNGRLGDNDFSMIYNSAPFAFTAVEEYPEIINAARIWNPGYPVFRYGDRAFSEEHVYAADSTIFDIFSFEFVMGDPKTALTQPGNLVLTEEMAEKYFGDENPVGKVVNSDNRNDRTVTAVVKSFPENSHWKFDFLMSAVTYPGQSQNNQWVNNNWITYLLLEEGTDYKVLEPKLRDLVTKYVGPQVEEFIGVPWATLEEQGSGYEYYLMPLTDIHLNSHVDGELESNGSLTTVRAFTFIALFILLLASINYMNLATARSMTRAREIGIRKTLGATRSQLVGQFLTESLLTALLATVLSVIAVYLLTPWFQTFLNAPVELEASDLLLIFLAVIPVGLISGSYPSIFLSNFRIVKVLRGTKQDSPRSGWMRNGLVVFQFTVSIVLFLGMMVISKQLNYLQTKDLGFNPDDVVVVEKTDDIGQNMQSFLSAVRDIDGVQYASNSTGLIGRDDGIGSSVFGVNTDEGINNQLLMNMFVDHDFANVFDLELLSGRFYSRERLTDTNAVVLNQAAARVLYGEQEAVGRDFLFHGENPGETVPVEIIGVIKDFNFESPERAIRPMAYFLFGSHVWGPGNTARFGRIVSIKTRPGMEESVLAQVEPIWKNYAADQAMEYVYFDDDYALNLENQERVGQVVLLFSALAIAIASLGLLGLASFTAERRTKEIGIRKVLGASEVTILGMLSTHMLKLVAVAAVVGLPLAYYGMQRWLSGYVYRVSITPDLLILAALMAAFVATTTVVLQSLKVALSNPVNSLRYE